MDPETAELEQIIREEDERIERIPQLNSLPRHEDTRYRDTPDPITPEELKELRAQILKYNQHALAHFQPGGDLESAFRSLKQAESMLLSKLIGHGGTDKLLSELLVITLNNIACYFKKKLFFRASLRYLSQILTIEKFHLKDSTGLPYTYMNISTVLSHIGKLREACKFAQRTLTLFKAQVYEYACSPASTQAPLVGNSQEENPAAIPIDPIVSAGQNNSEAGSPAGENYLDAAKKPEVHSQEQSPDPSKMVSQGLGPALVNPHMATRTKEVNCYIACFVNLGSLLFKLGNYSKVISIVNTGLVEARELGFNLKHDLVTRLKELGRLCHTKWTGGVRTYRETSAGQPRGRSLKDIPSLLGRFDETKSTQLGGISLSQSRRDGRLSDQGAKMSMSEGPNKLRSYTSSAADAKQLLSAEHTVSRLSKLLGERPRSVQPKVYSSRSKERSFSKHEGYMDAKNAYCLEMPIGHKDSGVLIAIDRVKGEISVATQAPVRKVPRVNIEEIYVRNVMHKNKGGAPSEGGVPFKELPLKAKISKWENK